MLKFHCVGHLQHWGQAFKNRWQQPVWPENRTSYKSWASLSPLVFLNYAWRLIAIKEEILPFTTKWQQYQLPTPVINTLSLWESSNILFLGVFSLFIYSTIQQNVGLKCSPSSNVPLLADFLLLCCCSRKSKSEDNAQCINPCGMLY